MVHVRKPLSHWTHRSPLNSFNVWLLSRVEKGRDVDFLARSPLIERRAGSRSDVDCEKSSIKGNQCNLC